MADDTLHTAFGGPGWRARETTTREELGFHWAPCGMDSEYRPLRAVLLHRPGRELEAAAEDPASSLMLEEADPGTLVREHDALAQAYRARGVEVSYVQPPDLPPPNQLFAADLFAMTPEGAVLGRPASPVRAGEERWVARALAHRGIPILRSVRGEGTFEGADLMWLAPDTALLARGIRTNPEGARQVEAVLREMSVRVLTTNLPRGTMHLMGQLRIVDRDLAIAWPGRFPREGEEALETLGYRVVHIPDEGEALTGFALNFVVLGPREILMPAGNPATRRFYEELGLSCTTVKVGEIGKAAGSIGCLTGILERETEGAPGSSLPLTDGPSGGAPGNPP
jgi:N-dimethylarginine dimethylaminohydrolase